MGLIQYSKQTPSGKPVYYELLDDGFKIYVGQKGRPSIHQYEPYIPDPSKTYEENALEMCKGLCTVQEEPTTDVKILSNEEYDKLCADIDYLMLLSE